MAVNGVGNTNYIFPALFDTSNVDNVENNVTSFADYLKSAVDKTNGLILESENLNTDFAAGKTDNIHQVMIAAEKADIALQFTMQIRNKILDAYNEIMRMQI
jgi:flagellar hook-basal body complex protein FliE